MSSHVKKRTLIAIATQQPDTYGDNRSPILAAFQNIPSTLHRTYKRRVMGTLETVGTKHPELRAGGEQTHAREPGVRLLCLQQQDKGASWHGGGSRQTALRARTRSAAQSAYPVLLRSMMDCSGEARR